MDEKKKPAKSKSLASTISNWKMMVGGYDKHGADLAFAGQDAEALRGVASRMEALNIKQEQEKAALAKTTEEMRVLTEEGKKYYASLLRFAKGRFGPKSAEIKDFVATGEL
ncbi:MAG: hypothetical protein JXN64_02015 [Spirochaetes bacterium]|nr:hypothetical protein [Spirochaetota bacterium]